MFQSFVRDRQTDSCTHERAMFPLSANEMAFINSVVFGTRAKRVIPRNFSSMPDPSRTSSTTSTRISEVP